MTKVLYAAAFEVSKVIIEASIIIENFMWINNQICCRIIIKFIKGIFDKLNH